MMWFTLGFTLGVIGRIAVMVMMDRHRRGHDALPPMWRTGPDDSTTRPDSDDAPLP